MASESIDVRNFVGHVHQALRHLEIAFTLLPHHLQPIDEDDHPVAWENVRPIELSPDKEDIDEEIPQDHDDPPAQEIPSQSPGELPDDQDAASVSPPPETDDIPIPFHDALPDAVYWTAERIQELRDIKADTRSRPSWAAIAKKMKRSEINIRRKWAEISGKRPKIATDSADSALKRSRRAK